MDVVCYEILATDGDFLAVSHNLSKAGFENDETVLIV
jgi:hypothetical protein